MIQDIYGHVYDPTYKTLSPNPEDYVLCFRDENIYLIDGRLPKVFEIGNSKLIYCFSIDSIRFYLYYGEYEPANENLEIFRTYEPRHISFAMITGYHLYIWYKNHKICGACGGKLSFGYNERKMVCPECGLEVFPDIHPAVIVGIIDNDKILLTKYKNGYSQYALVAGYTEIGETLEETVRREVLEEVGLHVEHIQYYKSQPWGLSGSVLAGFFVKADSTLEIKLQEDELKEAKWFKKDEIELQDDRTSLTREMILLFKNGGLK